MSLVEKAQQTVDLDQAVEMDKKLRSNRLDLEDFLGQIAQLRKMGPLENLLDMMPMSGQIKAKMKDAAGTGVDFNRSTKRAEAIIQSMTPRERRHPDILNASRKRRIASGSGTQVQDVNELLRQFEQTRQMAKRMGGLQKRLRHRK